MRDAALDPLRPTLRGATRPRSSGAPPLDGMLGEGLSPRSPKPAARSNGPTSAAIAAQRLGGGRGAASRRRNEPGIAERLKARLPRIRPFKILAVSAFSIALVGIVANAMIFQHGHHPAPLFGLGRSIDGQPDALRTVGEPPAPVATPAVPAPLQPAALAPPPSAPPVVVDPAPRAAAPVGLKPIHHTAAKPQPADAIGGLLSASSAPVAHPRPGAVASKPKSVVAAKPVAKPDHKVKPADGSAALARTDAAHHVASGKTAHPRPHAKPEFGKAPASGKTEAAAKPTAKTE